MPIRGWRITQEESENAQLVFPSSTRVSCIKRYTNRCIEHVATLRHQKFEAKGNDVACEDQESQYLPQTKMPVLELCLPEYHLCLPIAKGLDVETPTLFVPLWVVLRYL